MRWWKKEKKKKEDESISCQTSEDPKGFRNEHLTVLSEKMKPVPITRCVFKQQFDDMKVSHEDHVSSGRRRPSEGAADKRGTFSSMTLILCCTFL